MRIAYLTTSYPEVSHTFIRREILALEALGHEVDRLAIRPPESHLVDADDIAEAELTYYCLPNLLRDLPRALWTSPLRLWAALRMTLAMARVSHRGLVVNLAYLLEALSLTSEGTGNLLDNSVVFASSDASSGLSHSVENMPVVVAGGGGGALAHPGVHLRNDGGNSSDILLSCARTVCPELPQIGGGPGLSTSTVAGLMA